MQNQPRITIDGNRLPFDPGQTILEVAQHNQIVIPTLCHLKGTLPTGACRICVVEVERARTLLPACATPAADQMVVHTESLRTIDARKVIIELMLQSGHHNCAAATELNQDWTAYQLQVQQEDDCVELCPAWGDCRLQDLAFRYQVSGARFPATPTRYPAEDVNPFIVRDFSRCIHCGRCVQACQEIQVNDAIDFGYRGAAAKIVAAEDKPLKDSDCVFCGECLQACPVGALTEKNRPHSVRPWELKKTITTCPYCGVGCQLVLHVRDNRIERVTGAEERPPNFGSLCVKGRFGWDFVHSPERLTTPLIKNGQGFRQASWDEALNRVVRELDRLKDAHGPDCMGVLASARATNEDNYIANKFTRAVLKTNNIDHCARL